MIRNDSTIIPPGKQRLDKFHQSTSRLSVLWLRSWEILVEVMYPHYILRPQEIFIPPPVFPEGLGEEFLAQRFPPVYHPVVYDPEAAVVSGFGSLWYRLPKKFFGRNGGPPFPVHPVVGLCKPCLNLFPVEIIPHKSSMSRDRRKHHSVIHFLNLLGLFILIIYNHVKSVYTSYC